MSYPAQPPRTYQNAPSAADTQVPVLDLDKDFTYTSEGPRSPFALAGKDAKSSQQDEAPKKEASLPKQDQPFHIFNKKQTWMVVIMIGIAGMFSGLSSNIYFPSLDAISKDLGVSLGTVNLTITSYLIIQGVSPLFWGPLSDTLGRRPIYIASFSVYIIANIVLSVSPNFPVLLIFRGLQSAGSASTVSIGNGVIQDIATPLDRGAFIAFYQAIRNFSIAVGPVLGGLLAQFFGFRSVFVFLTIISGMISIVLLFFLPETLRKIAGNGTIRLKGIYQPLIRKITKDPDYIVDPVEPQKRGKVTMMTFIDPLKLLVEKDMVVTLGFGGLVYTIWSMLVSSTTELFKERFGLNEIALGAVFLPNGLGTIVGSSIAGKLMTRDFQFYERIYLAKYPGAPEPSKTRKSLAVEFPVEHARLRQMPWITGLFAVSTGVYGFTVLPASELGLSAASSPAWIVVPLVLQFFVAATSNAVFAINTTLVADLYPGKGASATAVNNLVRCSMGAVGVALLDVLLKWMGAAGTFLLLAMLVAAMSILVVVEWYYGMEWRGQREARRKMAEEMAAAAKLGDVEKR